MHRIASTTYMSAQFLINKTWYGGVLKISLVAVLSINLGMSSDCCTFPLYLIHMQLDIYLAFIEEVLQHTCEEHMDYNPLGSALEALQDLKQVVLHF